MEYHFLMGSERSGSNLITRIMDSHSEFCGPTPVHLIRLLAQNIHLYADLEKDENFEVLLTDVTDYLNCQLGNWEAAITKEQLLKDLHQNRTAEGIVKHVFGKEAAAHGKKRLFIKENRVYNYFPFLLLGFPEARFLYLVRDPRDFALSWKKSPNHPGGVIKATKVWNQDQTEFLKLYQWLKYRNSGLLVTYENLISDPESALKKIAHFYGVDFESQMMQFFDKDLTQEAASRIQNWNNLNQPILSDNQKKYRQALAPEEIQYIESKSWHKMIRLGYETEGDVQELDENQMAYLQGVEESNQTNLDPEEDAIRRQRLAVIDRVLNRALI